MNSISPNQDHFRRRKKIVMGLVPTLYLFVFVTTWLVAIRMPELAWDAWNSLHHELFYYPTIGFAFWLASRADLDWNRLRSSAFYFVLLAPVFLFHTLQREIANVCIIRTIPFAIYSGDLGWEHVLTNAGMFIAFDVLYFAMLLLSLLILSQVVGLAIRNRGEAPSRRRISIFQLMIWTALSAGIYALLMSATQGYQRSFLYQAPEPDVVAYEQSLKEVWPYLAARAVQVAIPLCLVGAAGSRWRWRSVVVACVFAWCVFATKLVEAVSRWTDPAMAQAPPVTLELYWFHFFPAISLSFFVVVLLAVFDWAGLEMQCVFFRRARAIDASSSERMDSDPTP